jgi:hypothetical protein
MTGSKVPDILIKELFIDTPFPRICDGRKHSAKINVQIRTNPEKCLLKTMK